ncbi:baeRF3 domain-containing protein [Candidatus Electrothrix sp.]|uniref:baeRF3 domain-containing protein n=1 Tax=Candidatus Electrothrix sp. TaxID=2170559 RepID=UPI004056F2DB
MTQKTTLLTIESLAELASAHQPPCLSLYQPTHRHHPDNQQDRIRFGNLVKELKMSLQQQYPGVEPRLLLEPFEALADDHAFWNLTLDGLAVLGGPDLFRVFRLQRPVVELTVAADSFHTNPLRRFLQSVDRYQVLGLSLDNIQLFEGNRDAFDEIDPAPGVPQTITEALGDELTDSHLTVASYGGVGQASTSAHHGHGGKKDDLKIDTERFFRAVDRAVLEHHSRTSCLPLILAALPEYHHLFHQISHNPFLMTEGLTINPDALPIDELRERAWQVIKPQYQARMAALTDGFAVAKSKGLGSEDLAEVARAVVTGRVATLLIEADRQIAGRLDRLTGRVEVANLSHPQVDDLFDDLLDDLGELVQKSTGQVLIIPTEQMPGLSGLAAIYRY